MAPRKQPGAAKARSVAEVQAEVDAQMQQLEGLLTGGEKKVKNMSLAFNNSIFKKAQDAFERCESINAQSDEMRDQAAADHAAKKQELGTRRAALQRKVAASASAAAELRAVQEETSAMMAALRGKMVAAPGGGGAGRAGAKRHKGPGGVTFGGQVA